MDTKQIKEIINNSDKNDWDFNEEHQIYTYKKDVSLTIRKKDLDTNSDKFSSEKWATEFPDSSAYRLTFEIFYDTLVDSKILISVDGNRAILPLPKPKTMQVNKEDYNFARIVDQYSSLSDYMKRADFKIG